MAFNDSSTPGRAYHPVGNFTGNLVSLHTVFRESLEKVKAGFDLVRLIVRCEPLPHIYGNREAIAELFENLVRIILSSHAPGYKFYLSIRCDEDNANPSYEDLKSYLIRIHANISTSGEWNAVNAAALLRCNFIVAGLNGNLQVNNIMNTGSLFSISLPGKMIADAIR